MALVREILDLEAQEEYLVKVNGKVLSQANYHGVLAYKLNEKLFGMAYRFH